MVVVSGAGNTIESNYLENVEVYWSAIMLTGTQHVVANNTMILTRGLFSGFAILVDETAGENVINGNVASHSERDRKWEIGVGFNPGTGHNFFGGNRMEAFVPFYLQNTQQVDWGGNVGY
jgi:formate/nitrite transporter FocA (FNT family)